jgi:hypothetical protein
VLPEDGDSMFLLNVTTRVQVVITVKTIIFTFTGVKPETSFKNKSNK